ITSSSRCGRFHFRATTLREPQFLCGLPLPSSSAVFPLPSAVCRLQLSAVCRLAVFRLPSGSFPSAVCRLAVPSERLPAFILRSSFAASSPLWRSSMHHFRLLIAAGLSVALGLTARASAQTTAQNDSAVKAASRTSGLPLITTRSLKFTTDEA